MTAKEFRDKFEELSKDFKFELTEEMKEGASLKQASMVHKWMLQKEKETPTFEDVEEAYHSGAYWGRGQMLKKWESLIGYIDLINHSSLTKDQHEVLDKILEESKVTEDELRRIRLVYNPNNPT